MHAARLGRYAERLERATMTTQAPVTPVLQPPYAADAESPRATHPAPRGRGRLSRWLVVLVPAILIWTVPFAGLTEPQRHLLAIFVATIVALVAQPAPMGVSALTSMTLIALTGTLPPARVLSGFSNLTVWLVFSAFLFARAVTVTRLGQRIAYYFIHRFGRSPIALGYSIAASDVVLAPFVPSDTARGGGIMFPVTRSVAQAAGSEPGPTAERLGAFLMLVGFHATYTASAMFLTGMAANPLIADFAAKGAGVELTWARWITGSIVPALLTLTLVPLLIRRLVRPTIDDIDAVRVHAHARLADLGRMRPVEWWLVVVMLAVMAGWVTSPLHRMHNTIVALAGVCALLLTGVLTWDDLLAERKAWDALIWFAPLLMMADALNEAGVIKVLSGDLFTQVSALTGVAALLVLAMAYKYLHYAFASMTAHVTALYPSFIAAAMVAKAPALVAALVLAYFSSLNASLTHYGTGSAPIFFGAGYVRQGTWWRVGALVSVLNLAIWLGVGMLWWKLLGWW
ncbi:MAG TPA: DASS family sodium-coupled anion symporter [Gemmatimonadaceae bacterium]|nr:DASS family sodium-coupled anion symporter [Gemmatimonadaceae bacterium]